jgi:hypothetical protein
MELLTSYLLRYRYSLSSIALILLMVSHTLNGQWIGDFWEHSAVVRELATNPFSPNHPQLLTDSPHAFYSPYSLGVAFVSRIMDLDPVTTLSMAGIVNLVFFLVSLRIFVLSLLNREATAFYALLFTLVLWGASAWFYSGFFHLEVLGYVLPYPSTFAVSLVFMALSMYILLVRIGNRLWYIPISVVAILVLLTHPPSSILMFVGLMSLSIGLRCSPLGFVALIGVFVFSLLVAAIWPYYPFARLILSESSVYHQSNRSMYVEVTERIFPALAGLPLIVLRIKSNWRDPLGLMALGLAAIYVYGGLSGNWSYGRVISYIVLLLHIAIADRVTRIESKLKSRRVTASGRKLAYSCLILTILFSFSFKPFIRPVLSRSMSDHQNTCAEYMFLSDFTRQYDVVLSDMNTSWIVPAFGGKVVATLNPLAFVPDYETRSKDVELFFSDAASHSDRLEIVKRYEVDFLLLNKDQVTTWQTIMHSFQPLGSVVFSDDKFVLIQLHSPNNTQPEPQPRRA